MRALITGATGFVGRHLLEKIDDPVILSRNATRARSKLPRGEVLEWDPMRGPPQAEAFRDVEVVFHLAGDPVADGRWTDEKKRRIRDSRVVGTRNLVRGIAACEQRPRVLVSTSAVGWYGSRGNDILDETSPPADDFLAEVCVAWEDASAPARDVGVRVVNPRVGLVLGPGEGALAKMLPVFRMGLGGRLGHGRQYMPWIHIDDLVGLYLHAATNESISGPMNAVGPEPVTNREFTRELARVLRRPALFPAPRFALKLAFGELADTLVASQRVFPRVAQNTGYAFQYPTLREALEQILLHPHKRASQYEAAAAH